MPMRAMASEMPASGTEKANSWMISPGTPSTSKETQCGKPWKPKALSQPAPIEPTARMRRGQAIDGGASWGWPSPRYSPQKMR